MFSRMAWDSWDTGFSIRLSKITCEGRHQRAAGHTRHQREPVGAARPAEGAGGVPASSRFRGRVLLVRGSSRQSFMFWSKSRVLREPGGTF